MLKTLHKVVKLEVVSTGRRLKNVSNVMCYGKADWPTVQCDQMLEYKVAQICPNIAQKVVTAVFTLIVAFFKIAPKSCQIFDEGLLEIFSVRPFKNGPIWSHCFWVKN